MAEFRRVEINLAAIRVSGIGGAFMVVASLICSVALPQTRWFMFAALVAGAVMGVAMILIRRAGDFTSPAGGDPGLGATSAPAARRSRRAPTTLGRLLSAIAR